MGAFAPSACEDDEISKRTSNKSSKRLLGISLEQLPTEYACPQQGDLKLLGPPSGQSTCGGARTHDRRVPADLRVDSLVTVPPKPHSL
ncbi:hypothetical protein PoB_001742700 [Plakobranchus ocellatus]|uniref:Uncharacterized protein n=1 Tax=Plakobranchus ocellatus TaxID=259542 RepID=A0AAV3Z8S5_9GAST|nr:hypothetical protein PoB_001742700 [Plakobranchus ocellatus]